MNGKNIAMGIVVIAVIGLAVWTLGSKPTPQQQSPDITPQPTVQTVRRYKNGLYKAEGNYTTPGTEEEIDVSITLKDGVVTDATFQGNGTNETTKKLQGQFKEGFREFVVGKPIDEIALTVVNGSSLSPKGFMDALNKIKTQAQES